MDGISSFLPPAVAMYLPYGIALTLALIALFLVRLVIRSMINKRVRSIRGAPAMSMMDIDKMVKKGLLSEAETRALRHSLAQSEVDKERRRQQSEREKILLAQVAVDPEAARLLLNNDSVTDRKARPVLAAPANATTPAGTTAPRPSPAAAPAKPAANAPAAVGHPTDLDILLEKGAISREEYERLKSFFQ